MPASTPQHSKDRMPSSWQALACGPFWADLNKLYPYQRQLLKQLIRAAREGQKPFVSMPMRPGVATIRRMAKRHEDAHPDLFPKYP